MIVLITGITSFLGSHTAEYLIEKGYQVIGVVRPGSTQLKNIEGIREKIRIISCSLDSIPDEDLDTYIERSPFKDLTIDVVIHFAWDGPGSAARMDHDIQYGNVCVSENLFALCRLLKCRRFVFAGSQAEYGKGGKDSPQPVSEYGKAKLAFGTWAMNEISKKPGMEFLHLRIYSVYGAGDHQTSLVHTLIRACIEKNVLEMSSCKQKWNYMEVRDCAAAISLVSTSADSVSGIYDIGSEEIRPLKDYVREIGEICGAEDCYLLGVRPDNAEGAADLIPDIRNLQKLGFHSEISFREGITQLYQSMKNEIQGENA